VDSGVNLPGFDESFCPSYMLDDYGQKARYILGTTEIELVDILSLGLRLCSKRYDKVKRRSLLLPRGILTSNNQADHIQETHHKKTPRNKY
jgi:hypothetical protein